MEKILREILDLAVYAPSGDNTQPWIFRIGEKSIDIINTSKSDFDVFDLKLRASYIAHGALIENIVRIAGSKGYGTEVRLFPAKTDPKLVATIGFTGGAAPDPSKARSIRERFTDRSRYDGRPIDRETLAALKDTARPHAVGVTIVEDKERIEKLADLLAMGDALVLENQEVHAFLYRHIRWTDQELTSTGDGMDIRSLTDNRLDVFFMKMLKNWSLSRLFVTLGMLRPVVIRRHNVYRSSSAMALFTIPSKTSENYVAAGRALQSLWLTAESHGVSLQPISALLLVYNNLGNGLNPNEVTALDKKMAKKAAEGVHYLVPEAEGIPVFCVRLGYGDKDRRSLVRVRKPPVIIK